jgi:hypothetical protein
LLAGLPFFTQAVELATAHSTDDYTLPELLDPPAVHWEELGGETQILPGVGIVAGQSHDSATQYSADALAVRAHWIRLASCSPTTTPSGNPDTLRNLVWRRRQGS